MQPELKVAHNNLDLLSLVVYHNFSDDADKEYLVYRFKLFITEQNEISDCHRKGCKSLACSS